MAPQPRPVWIPASAPPEAFPPVELAMRQPDGLLAVGGDLSRPRLLAAYRRGIFPWYSDDQPILWWSPDPRAVILPEQMHVSRRLRRRLRQQPFEVTWNRAFADVVAGCAAPRAEGHGTWITDDMRDAYVALHRAGDAQSVECWRDGELAGGVYGVTLGSVFFGESMFSRAADASKVALLEVARRGYRLIDCQVPNPHLERLGATLLPRQRFVELVGELVEQPLADD